MFVFLIYRLCPRTMTKPIFDHAMVSLTQVKCSPDLLTYIMPAIKDSKPYPTIDKYAQWIFRISIISFDRSENYYKSGPLIPILSR